MSQNSFNTRSSLNVGAKDYEIYQLSKLSGTEKLPFSLKILLENLLRNENGHSVTQDDINALVNWDPKAQPNVEIAFSPARVLMQDFTGVPAIVDLSAMREAMINLKGDPDKINPLVPTELVIDHSVQVDKFGTPEAVDLNSELEFRRNRERYNFLKWGQNAFADFKVVPPDTGIVHQVNLEYLARVIFERTTTDGKTVAYPDTLVGTDSHTTMINGLGVLGWGVGGIEAEAAMLGQPVSMLIPKVVGFKLTGKLPAGATATDLVLMVVEILRNHGVVGKFVEFYGPGLDELPLADRATIANMAPEYGATCGIFPIDEETLKYMRLTNRSEEQIAFVKAYAEAQGMFRTADQPNAIYSENLSFDLSDVEPSLSGPKRPQDRVPLAKSKSMFADAIRTLQTDEPKSNPDELSDGSIVIAAITSCTNTSNPSVLVGAGLLAQKAAALGLTVKPWVKTSLAPGSRVVTRYLEDAGLIDSLNQLGFNVVGYGCTTCIGNSGPLPEETAKTITDKNLTVCSILSGNRNFEGRIHALIKMNYLASPPLVVAYAIAGRMDIDVINVPLGNDSNGNPVFLKDIWPDNHEIQQVVAKSVTAKQFKESYADVFAGDAPWQKLQAGTGQLFQWEDDSTYVRNPPYFDGMTMQTNPVEDVKDARVLALLGDSITTDHISPAGNIKADSPAGKYLIENGVKQDEFNSYGSRRGNHEVMIRGTLANIRLRNQLAPGTEGGFTTHFPSNEQTTIYDASMQYQSDNVPLIIIAGKEYGSGSSRDWAAKGVRLLGVNAVIAESYERIHRTNLVCMGVLPLQFKANENAETIGLTGKETFSISGLNQGTAKEVTVTATADDGKQTSFTAIVRIDTPQEIEYFQNGGILQFVLRKLAS